MPSAEHIAGPTISQGIAVLPVTQPDEARPP
jgi:hypothetical protein